MANNRWKPSEAKSGLVLSELALADAPLRAKELWGRCKAKMSKATFNNALAGLRSEGKILRHENGKKYVTYEINPQDQTVKEVCAFVAQSRDLSGRLFSGMMEESEQFMQLLGSKKAARRKRMFAFYLRAQVNELARLLCGRILADAIDKAMVPERVPGRRIIESLSNDQLMSCLKAGKQILDELCEMDPNVAQSIFNEWTDELEDKVAEDFDRAYGKYKNLFFPPVPR